MFVNTRDAESFEPTLAEKPEAHTLYARRETYNPRQQLPDGVLMLTAGVDVQQNRLEYEIVGHGENRETWGVEYGIVWGSPLASETWQQLDTILLHGRWNHPCGLQLRIVSAAIDSGKWQEQVLNYVRTRAAYGVFAVKGSSTIGAPILPRRASKVGNPPTPQWQIGVNEIKHQINQQLLLKQTKEQEREHKFPRGFMHYPVFGSDGGDYTPSAGGDGTGYFEMLTAEDGHQTRGADGQWHTVFVNADNRRNEALDVRVYAVVAAYKKQVNYAQIAADFAKKRDLNTGDGEIKEKIQRLLSEANAKITGPAER